MSASGLVYALVHAPLVGPSTWRWVAEVLEDTGARVAVPNLHADAAPADFNRYIDCIVRAISSDDDVVLVGHSGAGVLLPFAAAAAAVASRPRSVRYVLVDAGIPPFRGNILDEHEVMRAAGIVWNGRASFADRVEPDGCLPPWHTWWGADGMSWLVPEPSRRAAITADIPRLPMSFFDQGAEVPLGWSSAPAGYLLLSDNYRLWADAARSYGWPVEEVLGTHLELVNRPEAVAGAIDRLAKACLPSAER